MKQTSSTATPDISDEAPCLTQADFDRAKFKVAGQDASKSEWQSAVRTKTGKLRINIMLDAPIVEHFKALAGERGYQTLINETLKKSLQQSDIETMIRKAIREELMSGKAA